MEFPAISGTDRGLAYIRRVFSQVSTDRGRIGFVALDHREDTLGASLESAHLPSDWPAMARFKAEATSAFSPVATAVLLDAVQGARTAIETGALAGRCGLAVTAEDAGFIEDDRGRRSEHLPAVTPHELHLLGAQVMKLLIYARFERRSALEHQLRLARTLADQCHREGVLFLLESQTYPLPGENASTVSAAARSQHAELAQLLAETGADILKLEFPWVLNGGTETAAAGCRAVANVINVPWTIFSAGVPFETFHQQVAVALANGCHGFVVGRALWQEAASLTGSARTQWLTEVGRDRLQALMRLLD